MSADVKHYLPVYHILTDINQKKKKNALQKLYFFFSFSDFSPIPSHSWPISQDFQQFQKAYSNVDEKGAAMTDKINVKKLACIKKKKALIHLSIFFIHSI